MGWVGNEGVDVQEPINCRDVRPVSCPVTALSHRGEFNNSRLVGKSTYFKSVLSLQKYVLFGRVFCCFDCISNIQTNFENSKCNTIAGSVISGLELGNEGNMAGKRTAENDKS